MNKRIKIVIVYSLLVLLFASTSQTMAVGETIYVDAGANDGLVGYWKGDEGSGAIAYDSSGNTNHGVPKGGVTWVSDTPSVTFDDLFSFRFDGVNEYVEIDDDTALNPGDAMTVAGWVRLDDYQERQIVAAKEGSYFLGVEDGRFYAEIWANGVPYVLSGSTINSGTGVWTHLAVTWQSNGTMNGYVNGILVESTGASASSVDSSSNPLTIGAMLAYENALQVSAGGYHTCALMIDGHIDCWGRDDFGQATPPAGIFTQVSAGWYHTCGLRSDGSVECWGYNGYGQAMDQAGPFTQVSAGGFHSCGLRSDDRVECWGYNAFSQATPPWNDNLLLNGGFETGDFTGWTQINAGSGGINIDDGTFDPAGPGGPVLPYQGSYAAVTFQSGPGTHTLYTDVTLHPDLSSVALSWADHIENWAGSFSDPNQEWRVEVWDPATNAVLAQLFTTDPGDPLQQDWTARNADLSPWIGQTIRIAFTQQDSLLFFNARLDDVRVMANMEYTQVSAGGYHNCGLQSNGSVGCWGAGGSGQATDQVGPFTQVSAGGHHTCGLRSDSSVDCWGADDDGQATDQAGPFTQVSAGGFHSCGLQNDGTVDCWGLDDFDQAMDQAGPFTLVSAGSFHSCGLQSDDSVDCWGDNFFGQASPVQYVVDGEVDDVRLYDVELSADAVMKLAQGHSCVTSGASWDEAHPDLQCALGDATSGDQIWVADGTYRPTSGLDPEATFTLKDGVAIYGGFGGIGVYENDLSQRDWTFFISDLHGVMLIGGDQSCHVVSGGGSDSSAILDGFTIRYGLADSGCDSPAGGGMINVNSSPTLANLTFYANGADWGGGMYNDSSHPTLTEVRFDNNWADWGGGMYNYSSNPALTGVTFAGNDAWTHGGGMYNDTSNPMLTDVTFADNTANGDGGGMHNVNSDLVLIKTTFSNNTAWGDGGGIYNEDSSPALVSVTFTDNEAWDDGGGMANSNSIPTLVNAIFAGNDAWGGRGGGIYNANSSTTTLVNATLYNNYANWRGGGVYLSATSSIQLGNSILWHNAAGDAGPQTYGSVVFNTTNLVQGGCPAGASCAGVTIITGDPLFVSAPNDLRLKLLSPAIDVGDNNALPFDVYDLDGDTNVGERLSLDVAGQHRIANDIVDLGAHESPPTRLYVDLDATSGANNGSSWADAFIDLQDALNWVVDGVEIWVAEGSYLPSATTHPADPRTATFMLEAEIEVYGGFAATESSLGQRLDWAGHPTHLSGNIGDPLNNADNSYHVVFITAQAVLDGFTISDSNANGPWPFGYDVGGGLYDDGSSPTLANLIFQANYANYGGALYMAGGNPQITGVTFDSNNAAYEGGGMYIEYGNPTMQDITFTGNRAGNNGGGMYCMSGSVDLANALYGVNSTIYNGGAIYNNACDLTLVNVTFNGNRAHLGAAVNNYGTLTMTNSIVWGDVSTGGVPAINGTATISYSLVEEGCPPLATCDHATNLYGVDPLFVDAASGNLHLQMQPASPATDAGDNTAVPTGLTTDLDGQPRFIDITSVPDTGNGPPPLVDMGAYEAQNLAPIAVGDTFQTDEDIPLVVAAPGVLDNDTDANGDSCTAVLDSSTGHGTLAFTADGSFTYTPNSGFTGADSFQYHATDGAKDSNTVTVNITVKVVNHAPVAEPDSYITHKNVPLSVSTLGVLLNDIDPDGDPMIAELDVGPLHGNLSLSANGAFIYVPNSGYQGPDQFSYHANDTALDSNMVNVSIQVLNTPPVATAESYQTTKNGTLTISNPSDGVLDNDHDGDNDPITAVLKLAPAHGTLALAADGTFLYIPDPGYCGTDSFAYAATDGSDESTPVIVNIVVINNRPMAKDDVYLGLENNVLMINDPALGVLGNDEDENGDPLSAMLHSTTSHGTLIFHGDGTFVYTPDPGYIGTDSFRYYANDGDMDSASHCGATITVMPDTNHIVYLPNLEK